MSLDNQLSQSSLSGYRNPNSHPNSHYSSAPHKLHYLHQECYIYNKVAYTI